MTDYKAISEINKKFMDCFVSYKGYVFFCNNQSDHFEKEEQRMLDKIREENKLPKYKQDYFDKEQFLRWCGVE